MPAAPTTTAVRRLAHALTSGDWIESLTDDERPRTLEESYDRQELLERELGYRRFGWKIAGSSVQALRASPIGKPLFGLLWEECRFASGATLALPRSGALTLEVEIAVRFAREVRPATEAFEPAMIDGTFVAMEVVRSRFIDRKAAGQLSFVSDDAGFHAFILGDPLSDTLDAPALAQPAALKHDDVVVATALEGEEQTHVPAALAAFWLHAAERGVVVPQGAIVTTGTQTRPVDTRAPGCYQGAIGDKSVTVTFR